MSFPRPENPVLGDVYFTDGPPKCDWRHSKETNFEVWDGQRWVHASEAANLIYNVQHQVTEP